MENNRRKITDSLNLEIAKPGNANGISTQLNNLIINGEHRSLSYEEKQKIIDEATIHYGNFLTALGVDWKNDPNSMETPKRVAKKLVNDMWAGRYNLPTDITSFPSDGYNGIILEKDVPVVTQCSHHHETILGKVHIAYIPSKDGKVIGLSKLNRIVEHFGRRGAIQEQLTMAIHNALDKIIEGNEGIMVVMQATHNCVSCRGIKHMGASMITSEVSGVFADHSRTAKSEVMHMIGYKLDAYR
jgi:GTP cyclohydrolase I